MTTKAKALALNGMHTAGIFSDMSFDGPEIGTLVLVIDRAKNLPNRKTIGKQDPYCAARLGKEAKKTSTDIRGGQTPRWDQELRFTVHDSPDYYQIKVSVFNDDKKTELIGEAWIDLRDIIVPGGGQSDKWHQLGYKGKYAGEVRIEITYYDSRPKPEKPPVKAKPAPPTELEANPTGAITGPRSTIKRRPLPSDPVTGKPPAPPQPAPEQAETPSRPHSNSAPAPHQQAEYSQAPAPPGHQHYQQPDQVRELSAPSRRPELPSQQYRTPERHEPYAVQHNQTYNSSHHQQSGPDVHETFDIPQITDRRAVDDDRPPPPPVHRSRAGSNPPMSNSFQATPPTMRQDVLRNEAHRNSVSGTYPGRPIYKAVDSAPAALPSSQYSSNVDQVPPARSYSYDPPYEPHRTMQATVEDVPESPESANRRTSGRWPQLPPPPPHSQSQTHIDRDYDVDASPAPLNLSGRGGNESARYPPESVYQASPNGYPTGAPEIPQRESPGYAPNFGRHSEPSLSLQNPNTEQRLVTYRGDIGDRTNGYSAPPVPASLVPGIDPNISQELSERVNQDRRQQGEMRGVSQQAIVDTRPRGRSMNDRYGNDLSSTAYNAPPAQSRNGVVYTNGPSTSSVNVVIKSRAYSPNPPRDRSPNRHQQHTIRRKSISPRPPVESERGLSGVPFGPDSYDALNPNASSAALQDTASSRPDYREETGKIISHDGREIDPSDHLPMESWAPEPEPKQSSSAAPPQSRPSLSGPQPAPSSGRRTLRIAGRPHSMLPPAVSSSSGVTFSGGITDSVDSVASSQAVASSTGGRSRLQKKSTYRQSTSAFTPMMSGANGPGPGPSTGSSILRKSNSGEALHRDTSYTAPRPGGISRASTFDYSMDGASADNHGLSHYTSGVYGTSPGSQRDLHGRSHSRGRSPARGYERGYDGSGHYQYSRSPGSSNGFSSALTSTSAAPPPIPAKVPLALPPASSSPSSSSALLASSPGSGGGMSGALQLHSSSVARRAGTGMDDGGYANYGYHHQDSYGYGGHGGGGGGSGVPLSLEEELRQIDIGTGRSTRKHNAAGYGASMRQTYGTVYGHGGY
ncbi:hypothetical protein VTH82DRAFT_5909 [Thermothelomyces myriococcoides]